MEFNNLKQQDKDIYKSVIGETEREKNTLEMIASENFVSKAVLEAAGTTLTNKYAEGYPGKRYYGGCDAVDIAENVALERVQKLFNAEYANVQPHSGSQANMAVYFSYLNAGDTILGMDLNHGGHLTHGSPVNFSGKLFNVESYGVKRDTGRINYNQIEEKARKHKPKLIIAGASAYPREIDFEKFREIADMVDAYLMTDMAHIAGLVATGHHSDPLPHCHVVTSTTHKTLRGPRGGLILLGEDYKNPMGIKTRKSKRIKNMSEIIDSNVMPGIQGGPLMHIIAAKGVAFGEALQPEFEEYSHQIIKNAKTLGDRLQEKGFNLISEGTDNHLLLINLNNKGVTGKEAENSLEEAGITCNKNMVPFDERSPFVTSGIRLGTPALTTRGMQENEMEKIADLIDKVINNINEVGVIKEVKKEVKGLCDQFPLYEDLDL